VSKEPKHEAGVPSKYHEYFPIVQEKMKKDLGIWKKEDYSTSSSIDNGTLLDSSPFAVTFKLRATLKSLNQTQHIKSLSPEGRFQVHQTVIPPNEVHPLLNKTKLLKGVATAAVDLSAIQQHFVAPTVIWGGNRVKGYMHEVAEAGFRRQRHHLSDWMERYHKGGVCARTGKN
jgi:hypothetical protein